MVIFLEEEEKNSIKNNRLVEEETDKKYNDLKAFCENLKNQVSIMRVEITTLKSQKSQNYYEEKYELMEKEISVLKEKTIKSDENRKKLNEFIEEKGKSFIKVLKDNLKRFGTQKIERVGIELSEERHKNKRNKRY